MHTTLGQVVLVVTSSPKAKVVSDPKTAPLMRAAFFAASAPALTETTTSASLSPNNPAVVATAVMPKPGVAISILQDPDRPFNASSPDMTPRTLPRPMSDVNIPPVRILNVPGNTPEAAELGVDSFSFKSKRLMPVFSDLRYLYHNEPVQQLISRNPFSICKFAKVCQLFMYVHPNKRAATNHVEYVTDAWISIFNVTPIAHHQGISRGLQLGHAFTARQRYLHCRRRHHLAMRVGK
ncbi:hypothetical protein JVU11DRAFT_11571 [Chiua virens]|nr:hypothetical protein JVU11DRAFT_11571 [Chiua virens]